MSSALPAARRRRKNPAGYLLALAVLLGVGGYMLYGNLSKSLVFFVTPTEYQQAGARYAGKSLRLGGLVRGEQYDPQTQLLRFNVTDGGATYPVRYVGAIPDLFKHGQGVVVEGKFAGGTFEANNLLVKHSEEYRPPTNQGDLKRMLQDAK